MQVGWRISEAKKFFFDREKIILAMSKATKKSLSRGAAFVWQTARGLIRKGDRISRPGAPPTAHSGVFKKSILFGFDPSTQSAVVGPTLLDRGDGTAPRALEFGGTFTRRTGRWAKRIASLKGLASYAAKYKARPFMGPALSKNIDKIGGVFADSVKGE